MTLERSKAEAILIETLGPPVKDLVKILGVLTPSGKPLALHRETEAVRLWFRPPRPPTLPEVRLLPGTAKNADLTGPLAPLAQPDTLRVDILSEVALRGFLSWYGGKTDDHEVLHRAFTELQDLYTAYSNGRPFLGFHEGLAAAWEDYKPRLRTRARDILGAEGWTEADVGTGRILDRTIASIEIQDTKSNLNNNLVFWQNRFGHANRDHHALIDARYNGPRRKEFERLLFDLYRNVGDEGAIFERLSELAGGIYPLLAYLFFVKDMDRFAPIQPTGFDRAFKAIGIPFSTMRQCSWANYSSFVALLADLRDRIVAETKLKNVRLIDAHSFCWIYSTLLKRQSEGLVPGKPSRQDTGRVVSGWEASIIEMRLSVQSTVANSNGQIVLKTVKNKELRMEPEELERYLAALLVQQDYKCALTGIPLQPHGPQTDKNLKPSLDRVDSNGHYKKGNLQVVCQFINFWKGASNNEEFKRLLALVRDPEEWSQTP